MDRQDVNRLTSTIEAHVGALQDLIFYLEKQLLALRDLDSGLHAFEEYGGYENYLKIFSKGEDDE